MNIDTATLVLLVGIASMIAIVGREVIALAVRKFWSKTVDTEYVTVAICRGYRDQCKGAGGKEVTDAMNRMAEEIKSLRRITVRHMLRGGELSPEDRKLLEGLLEG